MISWSRISANATAAVFTAEPGAAGSWTNAREQTTLYPSPGNYHTLNDSCCLGGEEQISVAYYKFAPQIIRVPVNWI